MRVLLQAEDKQRRGAKDLLYGCWCAGKRTGNAEYPPLDLLQIAATLENDGHQTFFDGEQCDATVMAVNPATLQEDAAALRETKQNSPQCISIGFGPSATFQTEELLATGAIDFAVIGEPENAIRDLLRGMENGKRKKARGIAYIENGQAKRTPPAPHVSLESLPIPDRKKLEGKNYFNPLITKGPWTTMVTTRGCPGECTFCLSPKFYGGNISAKSAEKVIGELKILEKEGYEEIFFRDETFTWDRKRTREICERMIEENLGLAWIANAKAGTVDKRTLGLMKEAGCEVLKIGAESGNQKILDNMKKGTTLKQTERTFAWARDAGIRTHAHFMLGCPGETHETLGETREFAKKIGPDTATFGILTPYPGTEIFENIKDRIKGEDYSGEHTRARYNELFTELKKEELEKALKRAYREFYFRPGYILGRIRKIRSRQDLRTLVKSGLAVTQFSGS